MPNVLSLRDLVDSPDNIGGTVLNAIYTVNRHS